MLALVKILMLVFIITIFIIFFKTGLFMSDVWGTLSSVGSPGEQIKNTMMVTLFCFFGVEGAVMMSARAKNSSDVGKAGFAGFAIALVLYLAVSLLCFGLLSRSELSGLNNPSIAYILRSACGDWAYWFVICAVIISLIGGWVAWTLVVAQVPYEAAKVGILPQEFTRTNSNGMPSFGLISSSIAMELFLFMVVMADDVYLAALNITGLMVIPCYLFTGLFMIKKADNPKTRTIAVITSLFCLWMAYAGGLLNIFKTSVFYIIGIWFFIKARRNSNDNAPIFTTGEKWWVAILCIASAITVVMMLTE